MNDFSYDVIMHTDGGCSGNPGVGAWAFVACYGSSENFFSHSGGEAQTTNNRMELSAAIAALKWLREHEHAEENGKPYSVVLYTDSQYLKKGMSEWLAQWLKRGWKLSSGNTVQNKDLWQQLLNYESTCKEKNIVVTWKWVKGHDGNTYNEMCHELVTKEIGELKCSLAEEKHEQ